VYVNVGKLASSAITGVANETSKRHGRETTQYRAAAHNRLPRGYEVKQAADFVRIRELFTSGTTSKRVLLCENAKPLNRDRRVIRPRPF
jgi:hypothetical protein